MTPRLVLCCSFRLPPPTKASWPCAGSITWYDMMNNTCAFIRSPSCGVAPFLAYALAPRPRLSGAEAPIFWEQSSMARHFYYVRAAAQQCKCLHTHPLLGHDEVLYCAASKCCTSLGSSSIWLLWLAMALSLSFLHVCTCSCMLKLARHSKHTDRQAEDACRATLHSWQAVPQGPVSVRDFVYPPASRCISSHLCKV